MTTDEPRPGDHFSDPALARSFLESQRWPSGATCQKCESQGKSPGIALTLSTRPGVYKCRVCRCQFSLTAGTILQDSRVPLNKWLVVIRVLCESGTASARHLEGELSVTYRTAWSIVRRLRYAFSQEPLASLSGPVSAKGALKAKNLKFEEVIPRLMKVSLNPLHNMPDDDAPSRNRNAKRRGAPA